jgi:hypothetical protein
VLKTIMNSKSRGMTLNVLGVTATSTKKIIKHGEGGMAPEME